MQNNLFRKGLVCGIILLFFGAVVVPSISSINGSKQKNISFISDSFDPFEEGWHYRKKITIDHTEVTGDLTDFPVLIITVDSDLRNKAQDDGDDIIFMDGSGVANQLYHEIEYYNDYYGELVAWVNVPSLSSSEDTVLYMYYGNPECINQQKPESVWDSNYLLIQHLEETFGIHYDSTSYSNDGVPLGGVTQGETGKISWADKFDGVDDYVNIPDTSDFVFANQDLTYSAWVQIFDNADVYRIFIGLADIDDGRPAIILAKSRSGGIDGRIYMQVYSSQHGIHSIALSILDGNGLPKYEWLYLTGVVDYPDSVQLYINAEFQDSDALVDFDMSEAYNLKLNIGASQLPGYPDWHKGLIDEVRISKTARSTEWISTSYNNQDDPSSFLSFGPEEEYPNLPPDAPIINGPIYGKAGISYPYTFTSTDQEDDDVSYYIRWGDGDITNWTTFQASGPPGYTESHSWDTHGTYIIQAIAKDIHGAESDWATLEVTMPKNKAFNFNLNLFERLLERFPILQKVLLYLVE